MKLRLAISIILAVVPACAQSTASPTSQSDKTPSADKQELAVLQAQLKLMEDYDSRLLLTVYWSLGAVGTVTLALVGFGWFVNFRVYERDKRVLREELALDLKKGLVEIESSGKAAEGKITQNMEARVAESSRVVHEQVKAELVGLQQSIWELEYARANNEREGWMERKVWSNAVRTTTEMLRIGIALDNEFHIDQTLQYIRDALPLTKLDAQVSRALIDTLGKLNSSHRAVAEPILEHLRKM